MGRNRSIHILELSPDASWDEIKAAYRDLIQVWHPDRFQHSPRLRERAERKTREINAAFEELKSGMSRAEDAEQPEHDRRPFTAGGRTERRTRRTPPIFDHSLLFRVVQALIAVVLLPLQLLFFILSAAVFRLFPAAAAALLVLVVLQSLGTPSFNLMRAEALKHRAAIEHVLTMGFGGRH